MKKLWALLRIKFFSQQNDTKIVNFDEGVLILWPFFGGNVIFKICPSISKVTIYVPKCFHCLASPGKVLALALQSEASMNKEKHSLRNFAALQSGGATQRNSSLPQTWLLIQKEQILKMTMPQKNGSRIKMPSSKSLTLVPFCWKKNVYSLMHSLIWFSPWFLWNEWS